MNINRIAIIAAIMAMTTTLHAADTALNPQALYLQAGKEERSGSAAKAKEIYESIIDRFPESDFAVKANDRLLAMPAAVKTPEEAKPAAAETGLFAPAPEKPLPADPRLRQAVATARTKEKAEILVREELARLKRVDDAREGRKQSRSRLSEKEALWQQTAERLVVEKYGATLAELRGRLAAVCKEMNIKGPCEESAFYPKE
ncbi:MAG: hypothetical protein FIA91_11570 [Geobacter sp.]|nr:hypothetical protein [Geobacter sp.]